MRWWAETCLGGNKHTWLEENMHKTSLGRRKHALADRNTPWWTETSLGGPAEHAWVERRMPKRTAACLGGLKHVWLEENMPGWNETCIGGPKHAFVDRDMPGWTGASLASHVPVRVHSWSTPSHAPILCRDFKV